jgi:hypothetical protein
VGAGDRLGLRGTVALELGPDTGKAEQRPALVEREPDDVVFLVAGSGSGAYSAKLFAGTRQAVFGLHRMPISDRAEAAARSMKPFFPKQFPTVLILLASLTSPWDSKPPNSRGDCLRNAIRTAGADGRPVNSTSTANPASFQLRSCSHLHFYRTFRFDFTRELVFRTSLTCRGHRFDPCRAHQASRATARQAILDPS